MLIRGIGGSPVYPQSHRRPTTAMVRALPSCKIAPFDEPPNSDEWVSLDHAK
jgi:hypothetical protein